MSKKQKLEIADEKLKKINLEEKIYKFWKKTFKTYIDESSEHLIDTNIDFLLKKYGLKCESKP